eukprot:TRINITY_DN1430_c0_g2_i1.p1 TRINITY_DN1430_c0_g2~~TRINITY_DN1430_c0_g2_i1.p1  ORF type:complete len:113 (+),score=8.18 TRINITY_DN1430_c0_g2_i1:269-607(+)
MSYLSYKKKIYYSIMALVFAIILFIFSIVDFVSLAYYNPEAFPASWRVTFMGVHIVSFYLVLSGIIYTNEANSRIGIKVSLIALVVNLISFLMRLIYELGFKDFRKVTYRNA